MLRGCDQIKGKKKTNRKKSSSKRKVCDGKKEIEKINDLTIFIDYICIVRTKEFHPEREAPHNKSFTFFCHSPNGVKQR